MHRQVTVQLGERSYSVHAGDGASHRIGEVIAATLKRPATRAFMVRDTGVPDTFCDNLAASLAASGLRVTTASLTPSEPVKTLQTAESLLIEAERSGHERSDLVVALGGGVVGDIAGFVASVYRRGVPFLQLPTTLLSMVDASVGGKTGVNLNVGDDLRKNLVGAFHQPVAVIADIAALASLPARELRCGLAECVKHGLIGAMGGDPGLLDWTRANLVAILQRNSAALTELVGRNVAIKAAIVAGDEREEADDASGGRALLNLGHTFGHAVETISHLSPDGNSGSSPLHHGEAVGLGLLAACRCAASVGLCDASLVHEIESLLRAIGLPATVRGLPETGEIIARMKHDKKVTAGRLRLVLPAHNRCARVVADPPIEAVRSAVEGMR